MSWGTERIEGVEYASAVGGGRVNPDVEDGRYTLQTENPLLSRITIAIWPWIDGARAPMLDGRPIQSPFAQADAIFHRPGSYVANVSMARVPTIVGHSGFATTDVPFVAMFLAVLLAVRRFLDAPTLPGGALVGALVGFATATKFTTLVFLPPVLVAIAALTTGSSAASGPACCDVGTPP